MNDQRAEQVPNRLPDQSPPINRDKQNKDGYFSESGVAASQSVCDGLTGLARQMCYATEYGVMI